jgi:hypothetical protein
LVLDKISENKLFYHLWTIIKPNRGKEWRVWNGIIWLNTGNNEHDN